MDIVQKVAGGYVIHQGMYAEQQLRYPILYVIFLLEATFTLCLLLIAG